MDTSDAFVEIWKGSSQIFPRNTGVVETSFFNPAKDMSHLLEKLKSTFPVRAYKGATIYEKILINL